MWSLMVLKQILHICFDESSSGICYGKRIFNSIYTKVEYKIKISTRSFSLLVTETEYKKLLHVNDFFTSSE